MNKITIKTVQVFSKLDAPVEIKFSQTLPGVSIDDYHEAWVSFLHAAGFNPDSVKQRYGED